MKLFDSGCILNTEFDSALSFLDSIEDFHHFLRDISQPPLVTGRTGLHDNAASADACR